jgi:hypothetical protein
LGNLEWRSETIKNGANIEKPNKIRTLKIKNMEKSKVEMFIGLNSDNFNQQDLLAVKETLEKMDDDKFYLFQGTEFQKPSTILIIAILLGWERFWLEDIGLGIVKIITCYGCGIWWIIDIITAKKRTQEYNFKKFTEKASFV